MADAAQPAAVEPGTGPGTGPDAGAAGDPRAQAAEAVVSLYRKDDKIYLHLLKKASVPVTLPALPVAIKSARLLHGPAIRTETRENMLSLEIPENSWDAIDTIVVITIGGSAMDILPIEVPEKP